MAEIRDEAHDVAVTSDDILGGTPVIAGTRIPAHDVMAALAASATEEQVLTNYPSLTRIILSCWHPIVVWVGLDR